MLAKRGLSLLDSELTVVVAALTTYRVVDVPCTAVSALRERRHRCLDPVDIDVESERELIVKFGSEALEEKDEILVVSEQDGVLDLEWVLYEDIILSLPLQRMHLEGECNEEMMSAYARVSTDEVRDEAEGPAPTLDDEGIDERWAALKALKRD